MLHLNEAARPLHTHPLQCADANRLADRLAQARCVPRALEAWCRERGIAGGPVVATPLHAAAPAAIPPTVRALLGVAEGQTLRHRRVQVCCGDVELLVAETIYAPGRLLRGMPELLQSTDVPFELVVEPLRPRRRTLALRGPTAGEAFAFVQELLVLAEDGRALAWMAERYAPAAVAAAA